MATIKELALKRSDIFYVDPRVLKVKPGWNVREPNDPANKEWVLTLARSIAAVGVQDPLIVHRADDGKIYVVDGHCRLAATYYAMDTLGAAIVSIPVRTQDRRTNDEDREFTQILSDGKAKSPYEAGVLYKRFIGYGWTVERIAERSGRSVSAINAALDLQGAPVQVQKLVASGKVSATLATETIKREGPSKATQTLNNAVDAATQKGKTRATKADIGEAPVVKLTASAKLARVREIIDDAELDEAHADYDCALGFTTDGYKELLKLLGL